MKADLEKNAEYLQYLKVSPKLIKPCPCEGKVFHQYCMTAHVIRNNNIHCLKCDTAYDLFVKKEKFCNPKLICLLFNYLVFMLLIVFIAAVALVLDGYLKTYNAHLDPVQAQKNHEFLKYEREIHPWSFNFVPDYRLPFSLTGSVRWTDLIHLVFIQGILMGWCMQYELTKTIEARRKLLLVEVKPYSNQSPCRREIKMNLNLINETIQIKRTDN